ncbi:MAG TPA: ATP-binding protein [Pyrinomonadaceae bacterium]|nr:ATP-binding protein [Pyrinomonadaceae bacterium]
MRSDLFEGMRATPEQHFKLYFYAAVLHLIEHVAGLFESWDEVTRQFPFLEGYSQEVARHGAHGMTFEQAAVSWRDSLIEWESAAEGHLPLRALGAAAGLDYETTVLLVTTGLCEEDARFGFVFETLQGVAGRQGPTLALLGTWWPQAAEGQGARAALRRLRELGLARVVNPDAPRAEQTLHVAPLLWDALQGERHERPAAWARYRAPEELTDSDDLIVAAEVRRQVEVLPALLESAEADAVVVRGPQRGGRRTLCGALARALGRGVLEVAGPSRGEEEERWRTVGPLATLLDAVPVVTYDLAPGETAEVPRPEGYAGPVFVALGRQGGLAGQGVGRALTITLEMPDASARRQHWLAACEEAEPEDSDEVAERFRMTGGNIRRAAKLASAYAALEGRARIRATDVQQAARALNRQTLDTLATRVEAAGDWESLAVKPETMRELRGLETRCRHRERLREFVGEDLGRQLNAGVRALFTGPSGTGKTLAARLLASVLKMDLYRLDLASVVNKYIGETEKSLNQVFARAEELDVILLLDEGDALLTQRTSVQSSNDRYANLETNYLLQRLETFEGILVVTTNASDRIDNAFQRRMDVVVEFHAPESAELQRIWQLHLPEGHTVPHALIGEVARRCSLSGGQIRNAALHASLLALSNGGKVTPSHLEAAVRREYQKAGAVCPLRALHATV